MTFAARPILYSTKRRGEYQAGETVGEVVHGFSRFGRIAVNTEQVYLAALRQKA